MRKKKKARDVYMMDLRTSMSFLRRKTKYGKNVKDTGNEEGDRQETIKVPGHMIYTRDILMRRAFHPAKLPIFIETSQSTMIYDTCNNQRKNVTNRSYCKKTSSSHR